MRKEKVIMDKELATIQIPTGLLQLLTTLAEERGIETDPITAIESAWRSAREHHNIDAKTWDLVRAVGDMKEQGIVVDPIGDSLAESIAVPCWTVEEQAGRIWERAFAQRAAERGEADAAADFANVAANRFLSWARSQLTWKESTDE
jgi:hypothetical protein